MVTDARSIQKTFLEDYVNRSSIVKDDGSMAGFEIMYWEPNYPMTLEFKPPSVVHGIYAIGTPDSEALPGHDRTPYGYKERIPIVIVTLDRTGVTGTLLQWTMEKELRRICELYPTGSRRILDRGRNLDRNLGSTILYQREWIMNYLRDTT